MTIVENSLTQRRDLWPALSRVAIGAQPDSFRRTLAVENGWTNAFASRVIDEYRRFLYIAAVAPFEVTPSQAVDEAWHLHLEDEFQYRQLCAEVLLRPLRHLPSSGASGDEARYREQYRKTLLVYESVFGPPPRDIWPSRTDAEAAVQRHSPSAHIPWVIGAAACLVLGAFLYPFSPLLAAATLPAFIFCAIAAGRRAPPRRNGKGGSSGCGSGGSGSDGDCAGCGGGCGGD